MLLLQPPELQPSLILVDEPASGLHPLAITLLAEMLGSIADDKQVVVATRSAQLISEFDSSDIVVTETEDGMITFNWLDESQPGDWLDEYSLGDPWLMNHLGGRRAR
jgi:predicted ATPase